MGRPNNGAKLRPARNGIFYITWTEAGRSKRVSTGTANLQEAQKVLGGFLLEQEQEAVNAGRWTVKQVCDFYDANHIETEVGDKKRQRKALQYIRDLIGEDCFLDELDAEDFTDYRKDRKRARVKKNKAGTKEKKIPGANDATIRRELNGFLSACNFAVRNRKIENRHVPVIELPAHNAGRDRWLTKPEFKTLLDAAQPEGETRLTRVYRFVALAVGTYRRRQAIETLTWFKVDLAHRTIDFRRPGEPETRKRRGIAAIPDWLLPILERAYREKISEYVLDTPHSLTRDIRAIADGLGMPDVSAHTLRHTGGTWAAQEGLSMWQIAGAMGCTVATAERNYLHHSPAHLRAAVNRVDVGDLARNDGRN